MPPNQVDPGSDFALSLHSPKSGGPSSSAHSASHTAKGSFSEESASDVAGGARPSPLSGPGEETFSEAVHHIVASGLAGVDEITDPAELKQRLRKMVKEMRNVQAYATSLEMHLKSSTAKAESLKLQLLNAKASTQAQYQAMPNDCEMKDRPPAIVPAEELQSNVDEAELSEDVLQVFKQWGWTPEEAKRRVLCEGVVASAVRLLLQLLLLLLLPLLVAGCRLSTDENTVLTGPLAQ